MRAECGWCLTAASQATLTLLLGRPCRGRRRTRSTLSLTSAPPSPPHRKLLSVSRHTPHCDRCSCFRLVFRHCEHARLRGNHLLAHHLTLDAHRGAQRGQRDCSCGGSAPRRRRKGDHIQTCPVYSCRCGICSASALRFQRTLACRLCMPTLILVRPARFRLLGLPLLGLPLLLGLGLGLGLGLARLLVLVRSKRPSSRSPTP